MSVFDAMAAAITPKTREVFIANPNNPTGTLVSQEEIDRYIAWPGQALAYMTGALEIQRLREHAERELGPRFDLRAFHDEVLGDGIIPLPVLQTKIERWIQAARFPT